MDCVIVNSKGFGGHNASASLYSPTIAKKHFRAWQAHHHFNRRKFEERVLHRKGLAEQWEKSFLEGTTMIDYDSQHGLTNEDITEVNCDGLVLRHVREAILFSDEDDAKKEDSSLG